jgi:hypothetical protein
MELEGILISQGFGKAHDSSSLLADAKKGALIVSAVQKGMPALGKRVNLGV